MKRLLVLVLSLSFALPSLATQGPDSYVDNSAAIEQMSPTELVEYLNTLSAELTKLEVDLESARKSRQWSMVRLGISSTLAIALGAGSHRFIKHGDLYTLGFGIGAGVGSVASVVYSGVEGWMIYVKTEQINDLMILILNKKMDLLEAKLKLLEAIKR